MKNKKWVRHFGKVSGGKLKKHSGRKKWIALGLSVVLIGGAACGAFFRLRSHSLQAMAEDMAAQSAVVEKGDISTTVVGTGNLTGQSAEDVMIPTGVKVESVLAESGDHVKKGDVLATLDAASVKQAMLEVQEEIETLDEEIEEARDDTASSSVSAGVSGTVKTIYAKEEKKVSDIMAKKGALMILVMDDDSETEIAVTGAQGTISEICVSEGDEVDAGDQLIVLEDVSESAEYLGLVSERKELAEYLAELSSVAATNTVTAEFDGTIQDVNVSSSTASGSAGSGSGGNGGSAGESNQTASAASSNGVSVVAAVSSAKSMENTAVSAVTLVRTASVKRTSAESEPDTEKKEETEKESETQTETQPETERISVKSIKDIVIAPVTGQKPQETIEETDYYTGEITWRDVTDSFLPGVSYCAEITLRAKTGEGCQYVFPADIVLSQTGAAISGVTVSDTVLKYQLIFEKTKEEENGIGGSQTGDGNNGSGGNNGESAENGSTAMGNNGGTTENGAGNDGTGNGANTGNLPDNNTGNANGQGTQPAASGGGSGSGSAGVSVSGGSQGGSSGTGSVSGSLVSTSASASSGSTDNTAGNQVVAFTVSPDESMTLSISVDELDILSVEKGQSADIIFDALEDQTFTGTITSISDTASVSGGVAKYTVEIQVPRDENMRVGMNASATIKVEEKQDILLLPSIALQEKGETTFVYTSQEEDGTLSGEVEVETGLSDGSRVEIISGLSEGDTVYYTRVKNESTTTGFGRGGFDQGGFNKGTMPNMGSGGNRGNMMPPAQ